MKKARWLIALLLFLGSASVVLLLLAHGARSRRSLEQYKADLRAKGEKLTWAELMPSNSSGIANSVLFPVFLSAAGALTTGPLHPGTLKIMEFVGPGRARVLHLEPNPGEVSLNHTQSAVTWADFGAQAERNKKALQTIREIMRNPPASLNPGTNLPTVPGASNLIAIRNAAQWLMGAAMFQLHERHKEAALGYLEALIASAQMNRDDYALVNQMIRAAVAHLGMAATWEALQAPQWTEPQLERLQKAWEQVDLVGGVEKGLLGERALGVETWRNLREYSGADARRRVRMIPSPGPGLGTMLEDGVLVPAYKFTSINDDELFYLQCMQQMLESVRLLRANRPWEEARQRIAQMTASIARTDRSPQALRY